jgi:hypothetical protein
MQCVGYKPSQMVQEGMKCVMQMITTLSLTEVKSPFKSMNYWANGKASGSRMLSVSWLVMEKFSSVWLTTFFWLNPKPEQSVWVQVGPVQGSGSPKPQTEPKCRNRMCLII